MSQSNVLATDIPCWRMPLVNNFDYNNKLYKIFETVKNAYNYNYNLLSNMFKNWAPNCRKFGNFCTISNSNGKFITNIFRSNSCTGGNSLYASHQYSTNAETPPLAFGLLSHTIQDSPAYKSLHSASSPYLSSLIQSYNPTRTLCSSNAHQLINPFPCTVLALVALM